MGRYVEPDRIGLEGGLNPYIYANGNPVDTSNMVPIYSTLSILKNPNGKMLLQQPRMHSILLAKS
ncbi:hypothetical protein [Acinetobacter sp. ESBL14]|uniref:hypothetical protein n=1 Tax=Acinetobacter sp. ESBL14 TaxID=3077329 RepID=UPI003FA5F43D